MTDDFASNSQLRRACYHALRYGGDGASASRMKEILEELVTSR